MFHVIGSNESTDKADNDRLLSSHVPNPQGVSKADQAESRFNAVLGHGLTADRRLSHRTKTDLGLFVSRRQLPKTWGNQACCRHDHPQRSELPESTHKLARLMVSYSCESA